MKKRIKSVLLKTLFSLCLITTILLTSIIAVTAVNTGLYTNGKLFGSGDYWDGLSTDIADLGNKNEFPIKADDTNNNKVTKLPFDILLGKNRDVISYTGAYPLKYKQTKDNVNYIQVPAGLEDVPYLIVDTNDGLYWANSDLNFSTETTDYTQEVLDYANGTNLAGHNSGLKRDLRIYALTQHKGGWFNFGNIIYSITKWFAKVVTSIMNLLISIKNINVSTILDMLGLRSLLDTFNKIFIGEGFTKPSIFLILALISLIITIVAYVKWYTTGNGKVTKKREIFIPLICGIFVIALALKPVGLTSIGTTLSNIIDKLAIDMLMESTSSSTNNLFVIESENIDQTIGGETFNIPDSRVISIQEQSLLNKLLIDTQICAQLGVDKIEDLNFSSDGSDYLKGTTGNDFYPSVFSHVGYNLGYYYWFANSVLPPQSIYASSLNNGRNKIYLDEIRSDNYEYDTSNVSNKMEGIVNFLQYQYESGSNKTKILKIMTNLAEPKMGSGALTFFLLTIELTLLAVATLRLVLKILISKLICAGSVLAIPIAGPLILSTRQKLIDTGKMLCFVFLVYSIQVFVLSVLFDLILMIVVLLFDTDILRILITIGFTAGILAFLPQIMGWLTQLLDTISKSISPELASKTNALKQKSRRLLGDAARNYDAKTRTKTVYDADGNAQKIRVKRKGDLLSKAMHTAENELSANNQKHTAFGLLGGLSKEKAENEAAALKKNADDEVTKVENSINEETDKKVKEIYNGETTENINNINVNALMNDEQKQLHKEAIDAIALRDMLAKEISPDLLKKFKEHPELLTEEEKEKVAKYNKAIVDANDAESKLRTKIKQDASDRAINNNKSRLEKALIDQRDLSKENKNKSTLKLDTKDKFKVTESLAQKKLNALATGTFSTGMALTEAEKSAALNGKRIRTLNEAQYRDSNSEKFNKQLNITGEVAAQDHQLPNGNTQTDTNNTSEKDTHETEKSESSKPKPVFKQPDKVDKSDTNNSDQKSDNTNDTNIESNDSDNKQSTEKIGKEENAPSSDNKPINKQPVTMEDIDHYSSNIAERKQKITAEYNNKTKQLNSYKQQVENKAKELEKQTQLLEADANKKLAEINDQYNKAMADPNINKGPEYAKALEIRKTDAVLQATAQYKQSKEKLDQTKQQVDYYDNEQKKLDSAYKSEMSQLSMAEKEINKQREELLTQKGKELKQEPEIISTQHQTQSKPNNNVEKATKSTPAENANTNNKQEFDQQKETTHKKSSAERLAETKKSYEETPVQQSGQYNPFEQTKEMKQDGFEVNDNASVTKRAATNVKQNDNYQQPQVQKPSDTKNNQSPVQSSNNYTGRKNNESTANQSETQRHNNKPIENTKQFNNTAAQESKQSAEQYNPFEQQGSSKKQTNNQSGFNTDKNSNQRSSNSNVDNSRNVEQNYTKPVGNNKQQNQYDNQPPIRQHETTKKSNTQQTDYTEPIQKTAPSINQNDNSVHKESEVESSPIIRTKPINTTLNADKPVAKKTIKIEKPKEENENSIINKFQHQYINEQNRLDYQEQLEGLKNQGYEVDESTNDKSKETNKKVMKFKIGK